jgi:hypothetical protein
MSGLCRECRASQLHLTTEPSILHISKLLVFVHPLICSLTYWMLTTLSTPFLSPTTDWFLWSWMLVPLVRSEGIFFFSSGARTQGLHLEPLHQPFLWWFFFWDRVSCTICPGWLWTTVLLISASWVARITGMSHRHPRPFSVFDEP